MRRLRSERTGLSYLSSGADDGPLVLCIHGFPDIPRTWSPLTESLVSAGYRVVSPWLPGYAPSDLDGPFDVPSVTEKLNALADALSPASPIRIVGHDWGVVIAQYAMAKRPDRIRSAVTLAVPHLLAVEANVERYPGQLRRSAYAGLFQLPVLSDRIVKLRNFAFIERLWHNWSPGFDPGEEYFAEIKLCLRSSMPAPIQYYRAMARPTVIRELRSSAAAGPIVVPTLSLHGERDGCIAPELAKGQEAHYSALFEQMVLADAGHFLHLERPGEVNEAILGWFEAH